MSTETMKLLSAFEALPLPEKQQFADEVWRRLPPYDSGPLDDEVAAQAGDQPAALLEKEEQHGTHAQTR